MAGRKPFTTAEVVTSPFDTPQASAAVAELQEAAHVRSLAVSELMGGAVTQYSREEARIRLRGLMAQGTQVMLEIGRTLIWVREHEPEAEFNGFLEEAQIERRLAYKFMQAARKFVLGLTDGQRDVMASLSRSKLFELVVLDDEEIRDLADGGSVAGVTRDDIDSMCTTELRAALREAQRQKKAEAETKARQIEAKNEKIDRLEEEVDRLTHGTPDERRRQQLERESAAVQRLAQASLKMLGMVQVFDQAVSDVLALGTEAAIVQGTTTVRAVFQRIADIASTRGMAVDFASVATPDWLAAMTPAEFDGAVAEAAEEAAQDAEAA